MDFIHIDSSTKMFLMFVKVESEHSKCAGKGAWQGDGKSGWQGSGKGKKGDSKGKKGGGTYDTWPEIYISLLCCDFNSL